MDYDHIRTKGEQEFTQESVRLLAERIRQNIDEYGSAIVGLSGGSTPKPIYEALGKENINWSAVTVFLVDDRYVPAKDKHSNQHLVHSTLLKHATIPESQIIFPDTTLPIGECITDYEQKIAQMLSSGIPHIVILGMGEDGHIASLFPPLTEAAFGDHLVVHTVTDTFDVRDRISVTLIVLGSAERKIFLLKGEGKKRVWEEMMESPEDIERWPAAAVLNLGGGTLINYW
ncbi:6-phosphogluconolactonase [Candidatus Peregrinibacteria bacterium]|nr:6-phosphogluconolactonase [Candidatus Peregrinibacteria bacterium]